MCIPGLSLGMASAPGLLLPYTDCAAKYTPQPSIPVIWATEVVSENPYATPAKPTILASIVPTASLFNPPEIVIPFLPSSPSLTTTELKTVTETLTISPSAADSTTLAVIPPTASPLHHLDIIVPDMPRPSSPVDSLPPQPFTTETPSAPETSSDAPSATSTAEPPPPLPSPSPTASWRAPPDMDDLSAFNIVKFSGGRKNIKIVQAIPDSVIALSDDSTSWDDTGTILQLFYPAGSINPAQRPVGGAQFYATPLDLTDARSVTLEYSVFFPADFSWVLAGKLPGLYGGHVGCSGGNAAQDCFSTRMMWRKHGLGELYLYAPKAEQTDELCGHPQSVCDSAYGISIGRGAFTWAAGAWTKVRQNVTLNTPGEQDGSFTLDINDQRILERNDIFYRGIPKRTVPHHSGLGGLLDTLLPGLVGRAPQTKAESDGWTAAAPTGATGDFGTGAAILLEPMHQAQREWAFQPAPTDEAQPIPTSTNPPQEPTPLIQLQFPAQQTVAMKPDPVGFVGLFFRYASMARLSTM
ncbi:hypothetical protein DXG03_005890 [Asterophora parasitica]|uniref:Polysaccharide lyase 14 domain-containing protein n=1 Tax=Asterophora parasitica TaxID=117018 RepID=A0A9P7G1A8_9AGAR|nr:hypothetical protein DXG03_005890 [Asterophora parasitica]